MKKGHIIKPSSYPIGLRIIALRKALNLKQGELARQAAISVDALVKAERRLCSPKIATKLSPILGVVPNYILEGPDRGQPDDMAAVAKPAAAKPAKLPGGFHHSLKGRIYVDPPPERQPENTETEAPAKRALPDELKKAISVLPIPDHNGDRPDPRDHGIYLPGVITQGYDRITIILERVRG